MKKTFESIPSQEEVVSSFRGAVAKNINEIRQNVDRKTARKVLDEVKGNEVFQEIAKRYRAESVRGMTDQHLVNVLLNESEYSTYALRKEGGAVGFVEQVIMSDMRPEEIDKALSDVTYPPVKESIVKAKEMVIEETSKSREKRRMAIIDEEKNIAEIISYQNELRKKIESLQAISEESAGFSNAEILLKYSAAFPESIKVAIEESLRDRSQNKVERILRWLTGVSERKNAIQIATNYLSALYSKMQILEKQKGDHVSKKLSLETSPEDEKSLGSIIKDNFRKMTENKLESEKSGGLEGAANMATLINELEKSSQFAEELALVAKQASFFTSGGGEAIDIAMRQDHEFTSKELEEAESKRVELQTVEEKIAFLENSMASSQSPEEIEGLAGKINVLKQESQKLSGNIVAKEKLVASMVSKMAGKIIEKASSEGLRKMANEFEHIVKACDILSDRAFGISIDDLSRNLPAIRESIAESKEMASEAIVNVLNGEITRAIGETPVPRNKKDKKNGAFDMELMKEYVKKGGSAVEFLLQYSTSWYCTKECIYSGTGSYITDLNLNKRLPYVFIRVARDEGYDYSLLRLEYDREKNREISPTSKSILWFPVPKELVSSRIKDLARAFKEYERMTSSEWDYLEDCDRHINSVNVKTEIHNPKSN